MSNLTPNNYLSIVSALKVKIKQAKTKAVLSVNKELLNMYWEIGSTILEQQKSEGWGSKIIKRLAIDLRSEFPEMKGLSERNLTYMQTFASAYPYFTIKQQLAAQLQNTDNQSFKFTQQAAAQLPWGHHQVILDKLKTQEERLFYIQKCAENHWSRNMLVHQIESGLFKRQGALTHNFKTTISNYQSELTQQLFKDPYNFDFLNIGEQAKERDLENALMNHIQKALPELGQGFAFMGRQYKLDAGGQEYFLDLLFYHTKLRRHIIIELKIGDFKPEYTGKMNLYLGIVDDLLKSQFDEPAIGLILCKTKNKIIAEYALRDTSKPIGIAEYKINELLPENIKGELPSIEEIEQKLDEKIENIEIPLQESLDKIKNLVANLKKGTIEKRLTLETTLQIFNDVLVSLYYKLKRALKEDIEPMFESTEILILGGIANYDIEKVRENLNKIPAQVQDLRLNINLKGFKNAGVDAFNIGNDIIIDLAEFKYTCGFAHENETIYTKLYHQFLTDEELNNIVITFCKLLLDETVRKLENIKE